MTKDESYSIGDLLLRSSIGPIASRGEIEEFEKANQIEKCPDSFFISNKLVVKSPKFQLVFNSPEAVTMLKQSALHKKLRDKASLSESLGVSFEDLPFIFPKDLKLPCSTEWKQKNFGSGSCQFEEQVIDQDWTHLSHYRGSLLPSPGFTYTVTPTSRPIPKERLSTANKILHYKDIFMYEDDLGDFGYSQVRLRMRVQADSVFILMRSYVRVDNLCIRSIDNRLFYDLATEEIIREVSFLESSYESLIAKGFVFDGGFNIDENQADVVAPHLNIVCTSTDVVTFNKSE